MNWLKRRWAEPDTRNAVSILFGLAAAAYPPYAVYLGIVAAGIGLHTAITPSSEK